MVGYGAMVVESLLGIVALVVVGAVAVNGTKPDGTPFSIFAGGVAGFLEKLGLPVQLATEHSCNSIYDHVCICSGTYFLGFRSTYRTYVFPGIVL